MNKLYTATDAGKLLPLSSRSNVTRIGTLPSTMNYQPSIIPHSPFTIHHSPLPLNCTSMNTDTTNKSTMLNFFTDNYRRFAGNAVAKILMGMMLMMFGTLITKGQNVNHLVISQVYGGGGNTGATYANDFVEVFNPTGSSVTMTNWSIQYASATGTSWAVSSFSGTVAAGKYFLIRLASGGAVGSALPTADAVPATQTNMSGTAGKVALVSSITALTGGCPTGGSIVDFIGFGTTADCREGTPATTASNAPAQTATTADVRASLGCTDANQNSTDFTAGTVNPRNSATTANYCYATKLSIPTPATQTAGTGFSLTITAQDAGGNTKAVTTSTLITLTATGSTIGGAVTGTITAGNSTVTISGITLTASASVTLTATATSGDALTAATSNAFAVNAASAVPTKFVITAIAPTTPTAGSGFSVTVQSQDGTNVAGNVSANTSFNLTTNGNAGVIGGTTTGTITAGNSSVTVSGVTLASGGTGATITATRSAGDNLTPATSAAFNVFAPVPTTASSSIVFGSQTTTTIPITSWTPGNGTNRIVVQRLTSASATAPTNGTNYAVSSTLGSGTVIFNGSGSGPLTATGLTAAIQYSFDIYEYNGSAASANYGSVFTASRYTLATEPTSHSATFTSSALTGTSVTLNFTTSSATLGYVIIQKTGTSASTGTPADGAGYTAGNTLGDGTVAAVITATTTTASITGLTPSSQYTFSIIPFGKNATNTETYNYYTAATIPTLTVSTPATTPTAQPTGLTFGSVSLNGFTVSFTAATGSPTGYIVLRNTGSAPTGAPVSANVYTVGNTNIGSGTNTVVYVGATPSPNFAQSGLTDATTYFYTVFSYNGTGASTSYLTTSPLSGSQTTLSVSAPTAIAATSITNNSFIANWGAVTGASSYRLDVSLFNSFTTTSTVTNTNVTAVGWSFPTFGTTLTADVFSTNNNGKLISTTGGSISDGTGASTAAPSAQAWQSGSGTKYREVNLNTTGFSNLKLSSKQRSSNTGPKDFKVQYKIGVGGTYVDVTSGSVTVANDFIAGVLNSLSLPSTCDNQPDVYLRWIMTSNTGVNNSAVQSGGTSRIDDILVVGDETVTDNVPSFVTGYNDLVVGSTSQSVTGLSPTTTYYYRVRAVANSTSANSNVITTTTNAAPTIASFTPASGYTGTTVVITGTNLTNASAVKFGGTAAASFVVNSATQITAVVAAGTTGTVAVTTGTTATSTGTFTYEGYITKQDGDFSAPATWLGGSVPPASAAITIAHAVTLDQNLTVGATGSLTLATTPTVGTLVIAPNVTLDMASVNSYIDFNNHLVTVKSTIAGTGSIGKLPGTLSDAGNVTVERYITGTLQRAWRLLAVPTVSASQTIKQAWQENQTNAGATVINTTPGFGTQITGHFSNPNSLGFDDITPSTSLLTYNAATNAYVDVTNTNTKLIGTEPGYLLYVRGDRSKTKASATTDFNETVLRTNGSINQAVTPISKTILAGKSALIGNPFISAIDLTKVTIADGAVGTSIFVYDPKLGTVGGYQTLVPNGATPPTAYTITPGGGSYTAFGTTVNTIQAGQAFFADAPGATDGTISFTENSKVGGNAQVFRPSTPAAAEQRFFANLNSIAATGDRVIDGIYINLDDANNNDIDNFDSKKHYNFNENIAVNRQGTDLGVEKRKPFVNNDTVFFNTMSLSRKTYQLYFKTDNLDPNLVATLEDTYLKTATLVNPNGNSMYNFTVDANAASAAADRFRVVFKELGSGPLPVTFTNIKAAEQGNNIAVEWKVGSQVNVARYEVERSADGRTFTKVAAVDASNTSTYNWLDVNAVQGTNFYRVRAIDINAVFKYTQIVKITLGKKGSAIAVSPNPVQSNLVTLQFTNQQAGKYQLNLTNAAGQLMYSNTLQHAGGSSSQTFTLSSQITRGVYQLVIIGPDKTRKAQKLIVE